MSAADGSFDSSIETATASFGSSGLADGRHTVYIRGRDSAGYWGTVRAVWIWILNPATAAHVTGTVTEAGTGEPLAGTVIAPPFSTASSAADGSYDLMLPAGTYDVTASAPGHHPQAVTGVTAVQSLATTVDFVLSPFDRSLFDDVESGDIGWTADAPWAIVSNQSHSPTHAWHESPGGDSPDGANIALVAPPLDLSGTAGVTLSFWHRYAIESGWDYGRVEWSADGGQSWHEEATYTGTQSTWTRVRLSLPGLDDAADARVRFRYTSDSNTNYDGWYIDDITLEGAFFADDFESGDTSAWTVTAP
jgi:hypothetical protein